MPELPKNRYGNLDKVQGLIRTIRQRVIAAQLSEEDEKNLEGALASFKQAFDSVAGNYTAAERKSKVAAE